MGEERRLEIVRDVVEVGLECRAQYLLFWALYDDGVRGRALASQISPGQLGQ